MFVRPARTRTGHAKLRKKIADQRQRNELFWVIKKGIKMTGMPSFGATGASDDEIWTIAAFVQRLPTVTPEDYKAWTTL